MTKIYAGIGSRETPQEVLSLMTDLAQQLHERGWKLRSGGAKGADTAFADGTWNREIHLPWNGYNGLNMARDHTLIVPEFNEHVAEIAERYHPAWYRLSDTVRKFMMRNVTIILGEHLTQRADMVCCWTPNGAAGGGTGHGIRVAKGFNIPVFDLARTEDRLKMSIFVDGA